MCPVTTTAFITHCWRSSWLDARWLVLALCCVLGMVQPAWAQSATEITSLQLERVDDEVLLSAQMQFELSSAVEEALLKGIPVYFVAEADILRERWYWYDKKVVAVQRHMRLAYQPLTRRWRLNVSAASGRETNLGLVLNQTYDTLAQALGSIKKIAYWKLADASDLDPGTKYRVDYRFRLDLGQLPRPFQIGALGQTDWELSAVSSIPWQLPATK